MLGAPVGAAAASGAGPRSKCRDSHGSEVGIAQACQHIGCDLVLGESVGELRCIRGLEYLQHRRVEPRLIGRVGFGFLFEFLVRIGVLGIALVRNLDVRFIEVGVSRIGVHRIGVLCIGIICLCTPDRESLTFAVDGGGGRIHGHGDTQHGALELRLVRALAAALDRDR